MCKSVISDISKNKPSGYSHTYQIANLTHFIGHISLYQWAFSIGSDQLGLLKPSFMFLGFIDRLNSSKTQKSFQKHISADSTQNYW